MEFKVESRVLLGFCAEWNGSFLPIFRVMLSVPSSRVKPYLSMGPIGCAVTFAERYHCNLRKMPKGCVSYSHRGESLESRMQS